MGATPAGRIGFPRKLMKTRYPVFFETIASFLGILIGTFTAFFVVWKTSVAVLMVTIGSLVVILLIATICALVVPERERKAGILSITVLGLHRIWDRAMAWSMQNGNDCTGIQIVGTLLTISFFTFVFIVMIITAYPYSGTP
ncbi:hypothetical protein ACJU26_09130 [Acidithiobacillus sp. M4-SHS-6]|uniref:hypothetical protein n=1 Tax=Acidithiobacillus sp. M4-SHS-6 TaxID=3383024 RepID=UPI0039BDEB5A